jgi:hypothetical protein
MGDCPEETASPTSNSLAGLGSRWPDSIGLSLIAEKQAV